jgi:hypothetical protein
LPRESPRYVAVTHELARGWLAVGELRRAEPMLLEEVLLLDGGGRPGDPRSALNMLADLCDAEDRKDDASLWREHVAALESAAARP